MTERELDLSWVDELLHGIDRDECTDDNGWWTTSTGVEFGAGKLAELKAEITRRFYQSREPNAQIASPGELLGYSVGSRTQDGRWHLYAGVDDHTATTSTADLIRGLNETIPTRVYGDDHPAEFFTTVEVVEIRRKP
ncbi:hypothetical protein [Nocardia sp. SC052]|uniref:hypothetical protein n=1 Tax=Nocardia sichangensis TaxID=3385975 RepID=UPI00399F5599